ncbi:MAG: hypothetical protein QW764_03950 [Desulfurococcaceae archaeon]
MKLNKRDYEYAIAISLLFAVGAYQRTSSLSYAIITFILGFFIAIAVTWIGRGIKEEASKLIKRKHQGSQANAK